MPIIVEDPLSHVRILSEKNYKKLRLSPTVRILIKGKNIIIFEDQSSQLFEMPKNKYLVKLFQQLKKHDLSEKQALKIVYPHYKDNGRKLLIELKNCGVIW